MSTKGRISGVKKLLYDARNRISRFNPSHFTSAGNVHLRAIKQEVNDLLDDLDLLKDQAD